MKFNDIIYYSFKNISSKGLRSWLTILGIIIGIASVVSLMTYSESINSSLNNQLSTFGPDIITVSSGAISRASDMRRFNEGSPAGSESVTLLSEDDVSAIGVLSNIVAISPSINYNLAATYNNKGVNVNILFVDPSEYAKVNSVSLSDGYFIDDNDDGVVLGYSIANNSFGELIPVGESLNIGGKTFKIIGVLAQGGFGSNDNLIIMNYDEASSLVTDFTEGYRQIQVKAASVDYVETLVPLIESALRDSRNVEEGKEDFRVSSSVTTMNSVSSIMDTLSMLLIGIASISLLVGAISISNTMFTSVYERTREIGIMKAIGALDSEVMKLFLTEAAIISLIGGIGGMIAGLVVAGVLVNFGPIMVMPMRAGSNGISSVLVVKPEIIALAILFSFIIGIVSGFFPARKAARLNPIEAIWYE